MVSTGDNTEYYHTLLYNYALLAVSQDGSVTLPNYSVKEADTDLSNWQLDLEVIQFTEYSAQLSKKLIQCSKIGSNMMKDVSSSVPAAQLQMFIGPHLLSASLWQTIAKINSNFNFNLI